MGLFHRRNTEITPPIDDVLLRALIGGGPITREHALTVPAVSAAVDFIAGTIASMPVKLYKVKDGKVEEQDRDARIKMLNGDTGDSLDSWQMKKAVIEDFMLGKGGYIYIERDRNDVTGLFYVADNKVTALTTDDPIHKNSGLMINGEIYEPFDFVKVLRNTKNGVTGRGVLEEVGKAIDTAYRTLLYQLGLVKTGGNKRGFLQASRQLGQAEIDTLKKAWKNLYANNEESIVVLNNGLEFKEASNNSVEMQLNESKKTLTDEINSIFHITPDFYDTFKLAIYPIIRAFETALNRDLLLEKEKKAFFFEFDVKEILRANTKERYEAYRTAKETGFMTINEIRRAENMNRIEGLDVIDLGLGSVLFDVNTGTVYTPNTDKTNSTSGGVME